MKNKVTVWAIVLAFSVVFTENIFAQERNLVLRNVKVVAVYSQYGNTFSVVEKQSGQRVYFWSKQNTNVRDVMSESMVLSNDGKTFDIYYYNDRNKRWSEETWMHAYGIGYQDRQWYIETAERVR